MTKNHYLLARLQKDHISPLFEFRPPKLCTPMGYSEVLDSEKWENITTGALSANTGPDVKLRGSQSTWMRRWGGVGGASPIDFVDAVFKCPARRGNGRPVVRFFHLPSCNQTQRRFKKNRKRAISSSSHIDKKELNQSSRVFQLEPSAHLSMFYTNAFSNAPTQMRSRGSVDSVFKRQFRHSRRAFCHCA